MSAYADILGLLSPPHCHGARPISRERSKKGSRGGRGGRGTHILKYLVDLVGVHEIADFGK